MSTYEDSFIGSLKDIIKGKRRLAIADDAKAKHVNVHVLNITACEIGLATALVEGQTEDGSATTFLLVGEPEAVAEAARMHRYPGERVQHQMRMGELLGYSAASVQSFIDSGVAGNCRCSSCGGDPEVIRPTPLEPLW